MSDTQHRDVGVSRRKFPKIDGIVCDHEASTQPNRRGHHQGIDGHLATRSDTCEEVTSDSCDAGPCRDHLCEASRQQRVHGFVDSMAPIQLDEHGRWDPNRRVSLLSRAQRCSYPLMSHGVSTRTSERGDRLAVEDQDGHCSST